ncbi:uncharacterized protein LOC131650373 [Vicia villosa]|uniref:uncharacterized protein LOC131650373 n=1 Tax=Vicia villosa TaxID=3911 RepID=UPI00273C1F4C|nr:uncharacterized protein LOC131650373 [Vicia villosa]
MVLHHLELNLSLHIKLHYKALFLIHSCVDDDNIEKFDDYESEKQAWVILEKAYVRAAKAKVAQVNEMGEISAKKCKTEEKSKNWPNASPDALKVEMYQLLASLCACQAIWLINILKKLGRNESEAEYTTLLIDNVSSINLAKNPIAHGRSKHIEMWFHCLRELVSEGKLRLGYCRSEDQVADLLTKGVTNEVFKRLKMSLSILDLDQLK